MKKEHIKEYFEKYIEKFPVYKNDKLFQGLANYLVDYYYDDTYNHIPYELKTLYEDQELEPAVYDKFLIAIGVPEDVINKLSYREKIVFLKSMSDFRRYKGTVDFISKIGISFHDTFNVYELYIDYNENDQAWFFKPVVIYNDTKLKIVQERLTYEEVYNSIPSFLVPEEQLENLRINNQITLPIKSNILLLDQQIVDEISSMNNLIISTFIKDYGSTYINVYFSAEQFSLDFKTIFYTWYYLASRYYGTNWTKLNPLLYVLQYEEYNNPYSIYDLKDIISEYNELKNTVEISKFYEEKFGFFEQYVQSDDRDLDDMKFYLSNMDSVFADYVENRITESGNERKEIDLIINDILNSMLYYRDSYVSSLGSLNDPFLEYFDYFLSSLPQLTINPEDTTSYTLIYNFKPYHTELLSTISNVLTSEDKFNSVIPSDEFQFHFEMIKYELLQMLDEKYFDIGLFKISSYNILSVFTVDFEMDLIDDIEEQVGEPLLDMLFLEYISHAIKTNQASSLSLSSLKESVEVVKAASSSLDFVSFIKFLDEMRLEDEYGIDWKFIIDQTVKIVSGLALTETTDRLFSTRSVDSIQQISVEIVDYIKAATTNIQIEELPERNIKVPTQGDIYTLGEVYTIT